MDGFALVDLQAQRVAVADYTRGWDCERIINWMRQYGTVSEKLSPAGSTLYVFKGPSGLKSGFYFTATGQMIVMSGGWIKY
jgi:hypothetical protein